MLAALAVSALAGPACSSDDDKDVRYEPTPPAVVESMLEMAGAGPEDVVYDLGSGDGRIVIAAARDFGVRDAAGVEIDRELVEESRSNAKEAEVAEQVQFERADLFEYDFRDADIIALYLLPELNIRLRPRLLSELEPGTRVVSHEHDMGAWRPDDHRTVDGHGVYHWVIPARAEGTWRWTLEGAHYEMTLQQRFQGVSGTLEWNGRQAAITGARLRGDHLRFRVGSNDDAPELRFEGRIDGEMLNGRLHRDGEAVALTAQRAD